jgi:hypothetical protein
MDDFLSELYQLSQQMAEAAASRSRHPGQAKREPGSQKDATFQFVTVPDKASPLREDQSCDPCISETRSRKRGERGQSSAIFCLRHDGP